MLYFSAEFFCKIKISHIKVLFTFTMKNISNPILPNQTLTKIDKVSPKNSLNIPSTHRLNH